MISPMIIFKGHVIDWTEGQVLYQAKGELIRSFVWSLDKELFIPSIPRACPVLLLIDSHSSHYDPDIIRMAAEDGIIVLALTPYLTHYLQPLDLSISSIHGSCIGRRYVTPTSKKILVGSSQSISSAHCFQKCKLSDHRMSFQASVKLVSSPLTAM